MEKAEKRRTNSTDVSKQGAFADIFFLTLILLVRLLDRPMR